ncbi:MAG: hypothetical protein KKA60_08125 [Proteobacteria bacterium]|nr:hypothetical protein [Pseudomonadota bacterium]
MMQENPEQKGAGVMPEKGMGAPVGRAAPMASRALARMVKNLHLYNTRAVLPDGDRPMVILASHGTLAAPMPAVAAVARLWAENGLSDRVVGFYPHPSFLMIPGIRQLFEYVGTPSRVYDVDSLVKLLKEGKMHLAGTAPEAVNCNFTWDEYVAPLRNAGMLEAAILADATVCLMAHLGGDAWAWRLKLPFGLTVPMTGGLSGVNVQFPPFRRIKDYGVIFRRYRPGTTAARLGGLPRRQRHMLLRVELEKIRNQLLLMTDELAGRMGKS